MVSGLVHDELGVLLEDLATQDLGEEVGRILVGRDVLHVGEAGPSKLPHLEELAIHVSRVLRGSVPVAKVICSLTVGTNLNGFTVISQVMSQKLEQGHHV